MNRIAALVAIALAALLGTVVAGPVASAAPAQVPDPGPVALAVDAMSPRVVTADGPAQLVVTGSVTNTGPDPVEQLAVRVQRGAAVVDEAGLRGALAGEDPVDGATPRFTDLGPLAPGESRPFRYAVELTGAPGETLALPGPGTYPLLVNVNGTIGGTPSRIASRPTVLPVSALPGSVPPPSPPATPVSMLLPITDAPRRIPPVPGQTPVLTDDDLATSFAPGGRLRELVDAYATGAPAGSPVRGAVCLAVDPELVATADAMSGGYEVVTSADGTTVPGRGAEAAGAWLTELRTAARGACVVALAPSDADLVALVRGGGSDVARTALEQGRAALAGIGGLDTPVLDDTVWPVDGVLDDATRDALGGGSRLVLSADGVDGTETSGVVRLGEANGPDADRAVLADPLLSEAVAGPAGSGGSREDGLAGQDLAGALAFRTENGPQAGGAPLLIAPPHDWSAGGPGAAGTLATLSALIAEGRVAPTGLAGVVASEPADTGPAALVYPVQAGGVEIPGAVVATIGEQVRSIEGLRGAAEGRTGVGTTPAEVFDPLVRGTLRAASSWWRGDPDRARREADVVAGRIEQVRGSVRVLQPPSPYSLGTSDAPLLITVANGLPVTMNVRVVMSSTTGLRVAPIPEQAVPPLGRVQVRVSAQVTRSGQFSVDAGLRTPDGAALGPDTRLRVRSTVYGTVTVWLTGVAGAVLVVLVVRRIVRRVRSSGGYSGPGPGRTGTPGDPGPPPSDAEPVSGGSAPGAGGDETARTRLPPYSSS
ncbi:DUF6049 family protein [Pseudonocardia nematodicida]|uniref:DUF6049 family protein n=1 Tax=Pseudonocardia nematodicida TaxID=1206997 RepID=A0ABV1KDD8_9PSEU